MRDRRLADVAMPKPDQVILTRYEACVAYSISLSAFDRAKDAGDIKVSYLGSAVRVRREEMERFMSERPGERPAPSERPAREA